MNPKFDDEKYNSKPTIPGEASNTYIKEDPDTNFLKTEKPVDNLSFNTSQQRGNSLYL
jgi:hypothetical protein